MAHLCPLCEEECRCGGDTSSVVITDFPDDCTHCDDVDGDELEPLDDEDAFDGDELEPLDDEDAFDGDELEPLDDEDAFDDDEGIENDW